MSFQWKRVSLLIVNIYIIQNTKWFQLKWDLYILGTLPSNNIILQIYAFFQIPQLLQKRKNVTLVAYLLFHFAVCFRKATMFWSKCTHYKHKKSYKILCKIKYYKRLLREFNYLLAILTSKFTIRKYKRCYLILNEIKYYFIKNSF